MIAECVRAVAHAVAAPARLIASAVTLAADPTAVELLEAAAARGAVGRDKAAAGRAGIVVVNALSVVKLRVVACLFVPGAVDGGVGTEAIVHHHVNVVDARGYVVVMEVKVDAHL